MVVVVGREEEVDADEDERRVVVTERAKTSTACSREEGKREQILIGLGG